MKEELKTELTTQQRRELTLKGTITRPTATIKEIYDTLTKQEDGEKLAAALRKIEGNPNIIRTLQRAQKEGNLIEKARNILLKGTPPDQEPTEDNQKEKEPKLTRICWCWLQP